MAQYFIDVFDGTDWALDPEGIDLPRDEEVEKAAVLALRVLVEERFQESTSLDLVVRVNDEDSNEVFVLRAEIVPDGSITRRRRSGTKTTERTTFDDSAQPLRVPSLRGFKLLCCPVGVRPHPMFGQNPFRLVLVIPCLRRK